MLAGEIEKKMYRGVNKRENLEQNMFANITRMQKYEEKIYQNLTQCRFHWMDQNNYI